MKAEPQILIRLFDLPRIESLEARVATFPVKAFHLLAMILLAPSRVMSRRAAAAILWDRAGERHAAESMRSLLIRVKRAWPFADALFDTSGTTVSVGPGGLRSDLAEFLAIERTHDAAQQLPRLKLVHGELLGGLGDLDGSFLDWLEIERARLRHKFHAYAAAALTDLTSYGRADLNTLRGLEDRMLAVEPYREESHTALIDAYGRIGMHKEVRRVYDGLREMLAREFGLHPSVETEALVRRVAASAPRAEEPASPVAGIRLMPRIAFSAPDVPTRQDPIIRSLISEVARELSRFRTFLVVAPHSSFRAPDPGSVKADYLITTSMFPGGDTLSCTLTSVGSGVILWACEFPAERNQLAITYRRFCNQTAASMAQAIERDRLANDRNYDGRAFAHFLEGQRTLRNANLPRLRRARSAFREACAADPHFAASRARLAQTYQLEWLMLGGRDPTLLLRAQSEARAAINVDPNAGDGYLMSGVSALYQRDFSRSGEMFAQAESLNPNSPDLLLQYGDALAHMGEPDEGWKRFERAIDLNPTPPDHYWWAGAGIRFLQRRFDDAIELCGRVENEESVLRLLAAIHGQMQHSEDAKRFGRRIRELYPSQSAEEMMRVAPNLRKADDDLFVDGLRVAGID